RSACRRATSGSSTKRSRRNAPRALTDPMLNLPFFDDAHRELAARLALFGSDQIEPIAAEPDTGNQLELGREVIRRAAHADLLSLFAGRAGRRPDLRALCLARETIAATSAFADSILAVHGLGTFPLALAGAPGAARSYAEKAARGEAIG